VPPESWIKGFIQSLMIRIAFVGPWARSAWMAYYGSLYPTAKPADFGEYSRRLAANLAEPGRLAALRAMMGADGDKSDIEARLAEVRAPTLVLMGTRDPDFPDPAAEAETVASRLHGAFKMIEGAGHYPHAEMPEVTVPIVAGFLAGGSAS
jgi:pimeloyl-ACP methyl ester carboxylesterase